MSDSSRKPGLPWEMRAVQVDLARRKEPLEFLYRYLEFIARHNFNTLVLYLEGRIRTASFPYWTKEETYTPEEMAGLVKHAGSLGIDVVPVIPTLAHCEQFLQCPELAHLAEERGGANRFGNATLVTFCPSLEGTYEFLARYLTEIAAIFPSEHLHLGCDETWNLGYCELCRPRRENEGLGEIYGQHVKRVCAIAASLGKRPWLWDDMLDFVPEQLPKLPRNVVLCHWNYDMAIEKEGSQSNFSNRGRHNWLAKYEELGFDAVVCPWVLSSLNSHSLTDYARRHAVWGGLATHWEMRLDNYEMYAPVIEAAGAAWSGRYEDFENAWAVYPSAVRALLQTGFQRPASWPQPYAHGPLGEGESRRCDMLRLALEGLAAANLNEEARRGLERCARAELLFWNLCSLQSRIYDTQRQGSDLPQLRELAHQAQLEIAALKAHGPAPLHYWDQVAESLLPAWQRLETPFGDSDWLLVLRLFLPDVFGVPRIRITGHAGEATFEIGGGSLKPSLVAMGSHYTVQIPFVSLEPPTAITVEGWGYGGQGVAYLEVQNKNGALYPHAVLASEGVVTEASALLKDDSLAAYLGHRDAANAMHNPQLAEARGSVTVSLSRHPNS